MNEIVDRCKKLRKITGLGIMDCKNLLSQYKTIDNVLNYLKSEADVPEFVGTGKIRYDIFKNDKLIFTCYSMEDLSKFNPVPLWYYNKDYVCRALSGNGKYEIVRFK